MQGSTDSQPSVRMNSRPLTQGLLLRSAVVVPVRPSSRDIGSNTGYGQLKYPSIQQVVIPGPIHFDNQPSVRMNSRSVRRYAQVLNVDGIQSWTFSLQQHLVRSEGDYNGPTGPHMAVLYLRRTV